jgi:NADPH:quinone reductase-like Zn-dependent oxidoreductase
VRAVVYDRYGTPDDLRIEDVPTPAPSAKQVLLRVVATSINLTDWEALTGRPLYARTGGLRSPARRILGSDIAGVVEAVGSEATKFRVGDEVYGDNLDAMGGFAEFAVAPESVLALKPPELSFAEASTIPQSGAIAIAGTAGLESGQRLLVVGAGGGSGAFVIQLAKRAGALVTAVDNAGKLDFMSSLGADEVIDYRTQDFTKTGPYDRILDMVGGRSVFAYRRALARGGRYSVVGGTVRTLLRTITGGALLGAITGRKLGLLIVRLGPAGFEPLTELCVAGDVRIHIDATFSLDEVPLALARLGEGKTLGKAVIQVG